MGRPIFARPDAAARLLGATPPAEDEVRGRQPRVVRHALQVLECVAASGGGITAQEVSAALGLSRATTYRLVQVLVEDEYLVRLPDLRGFALGSRVAALASAPPPPARPPRAAREVLARLRAGLRGGVHLVRLDGQGPVVGDEDPDFPLAADADVRGLLDGVCADLAAAAGDAARSAGDVARTADTAVARTAGTTDVARTVGAWTALAAAVVDEDGAPVAALVALAPADRLPDPDAAAERLRAAADDLGPLLA
ncbi:helix-turn-helix domain-containing protein [Xylanimonas ulmi]|uniref:DNA-binding IclR family transcriptional regulator n=1 Tax=Xylanimonas ulmi TaxID=228973 RepID=A0A4Q7M325_9MICO|nr:helix-turn-helix domain-containing protein [Xylanibacterium ulmi]RZS62306.1 DNA-binding IclR family transcriptional regulator [Xylanibacterium ulmi]